jgi:hypothetical protein
MRALDGEIGKVEDFYFADDSWTVRYLILKTGSWLFGRKVLISPLALIKTVPEPGVIPVSLTKEQILRSPDIDTDKPVSRQQEVELYGHYTWQNYWGSGFYAGGLWDISHSNPVIDEKIVKPENLDTKSGDDPHLGSTIKVMSYRLHAKDGECGRVIDFIINDQSWQIFHLVLELPHWLGGKKVLIAVRHIKKIEWESSEVFLDVDISFLKNCAALEESEGLYTEADNTVYDNPNIHLD